jgi:large subunit ribosomal protein L32
MAVPRNRTSNARKNSRRAHHAKKPKNIHPCPRCNSPKLPHTICQSCGAYKGQIVIAQEQE